MLNQLHAYKIKWKSQYVVELCELKKMGSKHLTIFSSPHVFGNLPSTLIVDGRCSAVFGMKVGRHDESGGRGVVAGCGWVLESI